MSYIVRLIEMDVAEKLNFSTDKYSMEFAILPSIYKYLTRINFL